MREIYFSNFLAPCLALTLVWGNWSWFGHAPVTCWLERDSSREKGYSQSTRLVVKEPCPVWAYWNFRKQIDWLRFSSVEVVLPLVSSWFPRCNEVTWVCQCLSVTSGPRGWHHLGLTMAITFVTLLTRPPGATAGARIDFHTLFTNKTSSLRSLVPRNETSEASFKKASLKLNWLICSLGIV